MCTVPPYEGFCGCDINFVLFLLAETDRDLGVARHVVGPAIQSSEHHGGLWLRRDDGDYKCI